MSTSRPEVGWWTTICCDEDLRQIENAADLSECLADAEEVGRTFWPTKEAALRDLARLTQRINV
jgi:hypothetical protein